MKHIFHLLAVALLFGSCSADVVVSHQDKSAYTITTSPAEDTRTQMNFSWATDTKGGRDPLPKALKGFCVPLLTASTQRPTTERTSMKMWLSINTMPQSPVCSLIPVTNTESSLLTHHQYTTSILQEPENGRPASYRTFMSTHPYTAGHRLPWI